MSQKKKKKSKSPDICFTSVYLTDKSEYLRGLYDLLEERTKDENISHTKMPTYEQHLKFVYSQPYLKWFLILHKDKLIGSIYETKNHEIGIHIFKTQRRQGYGKKAIIDFMQWCCAKDFYANINPKNTKSIKFFESLGFKHVQNTYKFKPS